MESIVEVKELSKRYGAFAALDRCELTVPRGTIFGLLGPNGAGKTTLIRCLLGFIRPSSGSAWLAGLDCLHQSVAIRRHTAYLPAEARMFRSMRGKDVIDFFGEVHPFGSSKRARLIADRLQLDLSRRVAFMSTGMRQKLAIACVLSCRATLLILDEPTANLDPSVRAEVLSLIREAQQTEATILFSSHILSEIEELCGPAAILNSGRVARTLSVPQLRSIHRVSAVLGASLNAPWPSETGLPHEVKIVEQTAQRVLLEVSGPLQPHLQWLGSLPLKDIQIEPIGLKTIYESCCAS